MSFTDSRAQLDTIPSILGVTIELQFTHLAQVRAQKKTTFHTLLRTQSIKRPHWPRLTLGCVFTNFIALGPISYR